MKVQLPFSFLEGNKFPNACVQVTFDPPVMVVWEQGISSFCPSFQFLYCKEQLRVTSGVFTFHFVGQHTSVFGVQALIEAFSFHLLHMLKLNPYCILWLEYLDLLWQAHSELSHILPRSLLLGIEFLTKNVECHHYAIVLIQHLKDVGQGPCLKSQKGLKGILLIISRCMATSVGHPNPSSGK